MNRWIGSCVACAVLGGCAVGPDFAPPAPPKAPGYSATPIVSRMAPGSGEPAQRLVRGSEVPRQWWKAFGSPALNAVVAEAIEGSPTIEAARTRLAAAQDLVRAARGGYYPQIDAGAFAARQKGPPFAAGLLQPRPVPTYDLYSVGPTVSFVPDVFGSTARHVEEQSALEEQQRDELAAARLAVAGNAVAQAFAIASNRMQLEAIDGIVADDEKTLALTWQKFDAGKVDRGEVLAAQARLETDRTAAPPLEQQLSAARDALAALLGRSPGAWAAPDFALDEFTLPAELPVRIPSELVRRRPDIRAAQAQLHASSAAIGVATGRLYPTIVLSGAIEPAALTPGVLFDRQNLDWNLLAGITAPIFHGGTLRAQRDAAVDTFRSTLALYREVVLQSFRQVADTLHALSHDAELVRGERRALDASRADRDLARQRYATGKTDLIRLLDVQRSVEQARVGYARARAQRDLDSAALYVALGGGE